MNYEDYRNKQVQDAVVDSSEGRKAITKVLAQKIRAARTKLAFYKSANAVKRYSDKSLKTKLSNHAVLRKSNQVTVVENQPVYSKDRSKFFKTAWEVEKKQLFFD